MIFGAYIRSRYFCCAAPDRDAAQLVLWRQLNACDWHVPLAEIRPFPARPRAIVGLVERGGQRRARC